MGLLSGILPILGAVGGNMIAPGIGGSIGAALGGALGGASSSGSQQQTQTRAPWEAAQPWLKDLITQGQGMQQHYMQHPFSDTQQAAYSNLFGLLNGMNGMGQGLLANNNALGQGYNRFADPKTRSQSGFKPLQLNFQPGLLSPNFATYGSAAMQAQQPQPMPQQQQPQQQVPAWMDPYRGYGDN